MSQSRRVVGWLGALVGSAIIFITLLADQLGLGSGHPGIGRAQIGGIALGVAIVAGRKLIAALLMGPDRTTALVKMLPPPEHRALWGFGLLAVLVALIIIVAIAGEPLTENFP